MALFIWKDSEISKIIIDSSISSYSSVIFHLMLILCCFICIHYLLYIYFFNWPLLSICELWTSKILKLDLEKAEESEIKLSTSLRLLKKQESSRKNLLLLYWLCQSLWLCGSQQTRKFWKRGIPDHLSCLLRNLYAGQEATV